MAFPSVSEVDLVLALQDGAAAGGQWEPFLDRLARMTGARFAALVSRVPGLPGFLHVAAAGPSPVHASDAPALAIVLGERMRPERIYAAAELAELTGDDGVDLSVDTMLARLGAISINAVRVAVPSVTLSLGIFGARPFDAADGAVLRRLVPFLTAAASGASRVWHEQLRATLTAGLAERAGLGWFLLDAAGTVLDSWMAPDAPAAVRVLPGPHGDRLALADQASESALAAILDRLAAEPASRPRALRIASDPPLHLQVGPVPPGHAPDPRRPVALATLHGEARLGQHGAALLVDLFGLLPSEARLAAALADGDRLDEAAARFGLTIETVRNYSKKIFSKTGTRGQADLVRLVLSSGLAAPG